MTKYRSTAIVAALAFTIVGSGHAQAKFSGEVLQGFRLVSPATVNVDVPPAGVTLEIMATETSGPGLGKVAFTFRSPSGHQFISGEQTLAGVSTQPFDGEIETVFSGGGLQPHGLNGFSEPGTWTLDSITLCDALAGCSTISGAALAAVGAPPTIMVVNRHPAATAIPVITSAAIPLPTVKELQLQDGSFVAPSPYVAITATDGAPGIVAASATFAPPMNACFGNALSGYKPILAHALAPGVPQMTFVAGLTTSGLACATSLAGVYTLVRLEVADQAGNVLDVHTPAALKALLPGGTTFTITQ